MNNYRKGVFFVLYRKNKDKVEYLVLHRKLHWRGWEFPKAGLEEGEKEKETIKREIKEEAGGCVILNIKDLKIKGKYKYDRKMADRKPWEGQTYKLFSVKVKCNRVKIDREEHDGYKWLNFEKAIGLLTWPNQRKCLKIVNNSL